MSDKKITQFYCCKKCSHETPLAEWNQGYRVCASCGYHAFLGARKRIELLLEPGWRLHFEQIVPTDPLLFVDDKPYPERVSEARKATGATESILIAQGVLVQRPVLVMAMEFKFLGGSLGSAAGERVWRTFEYAATHKLPVIAFPSSGGARMQEGIIALQQMAKTATAVAKFQESGLPYIVVLTYPTFGGVSASFAALGDIILSEPGALIGFSGPRVIEQVTGQKLPPGFQGADFVRDHGFIDAIVPRSCQRDTLNQLLNFLL